MKEKKPSWLERYEARQREQVTHSTDIHFIPGVPTEDGWYVVKSERNEYTFCGYKAWSAVEPKPMTQLEKAREEIAAYQAEHYPHGECPECGFALDSEGNCTRSDYAYPDED